jgi:tetratricopeptide (TPR) repeat protein
MAEGNAMLGKIARDEGRLDEAAAHYHAAAELARRAADSGVLAHRLRHLGEIHLEAGRADLAAPPLEEALALRRSDPGVTALEMANTLRPMALLREALGERESARRYWAEARALYAEAGIAAGVAGCDRRLAALAR